MKIGTITFHFAINYGAVLQAYALQKWCINQGLSSEIINYCPKEHIESYNLTERYRTLLWGHGLKNTYKSLRYLLFNKKAYEIKKSKFESFRSKYLAQSQEFMDARDFSSRSYDAIICGSDQIWNYEITNGFDPMYFGSAENHKIPIISYAASVGSNNILDNLYYLEKFKECVSNIDYVGVREYQLSKLLKDKDICDSTVVCDPVFLLGKTQYEILQKGLLNNCKPYLLIYQLERYSETYKVAKQIANEKGLDIIELCGTPYNSLHGKNVITDAGPEEFLSLLYNASYVVTNSFHGTAFSIIFNTPFSVVLSRGRNDRLISLLKQFNLEDRIFSSGSPLNDIDFALINKTLLDIKKRSEMFLLKAIGGRHTKERYIAKTEKCIACKVQDKELLRLVSSGGLCFTLSRQYILEGGVAYGVSYCEGFRKVEYKRIDTLEELPSIIGSKYVKANIKSVFASIADDLRKQLKVCVVALPCEIAALTSYLNKNNIDRTKLLAVDMICHGPGYSSYLEETVQRLERKYHSRIVEFSLRYKYLGWTPPYLYAKFENGKTYLEELALSDFGVSFYAAPQKCSFNCKYKGTNRASDFTVGDYWGCSKDNPVYDSMGISVAIIHNTDKASILNSINGLVISDAEYDSVMRGNPSYSEPRKNSEQADRYFDMVKTRGIHKASKSQLNFKRRVVRAIPVKLRLFLLDVKRHGRKMQ